MNEPIYQGQEEFRTGGDLLRCSEMFCGELATHVAKERNASERSLYFCKEHIEAAIDARRVFGIEALKEYEVFLKKHAIYKQTLKHIDEQESIFPCP